MLQAAAQQAVESEDSVPAGLSVDRVRAGAKLALASMTEWEFAILQPIARSRL